jgi:beta-lactamase regulating signal transducer with metallopeptidase domain/HEAT repeat protein
MSATVTLLIWLAKATALLMLALGVTLGLRRAPAGARYIVWLATLATLLLVPAVSQWSPLPLRILPSETPVFARFVPEPVSMPATSPQPSRVATPSPSAPSVTAPSRIELSATTTLLLAWGAVGAVLLGWLLLGALAVRRIVTRARILNDAAWLGPMYDVADRLDLDHAPRLVMSPVIEMPFACGILRPTIVLPISAERWSDERRRVVLFHELAHIRRRDLIGHTLGRIVCAFYWFHPLVWSAAKHLRAESERACDDLVLACGGARASDYANHLLEIVTAVGVQGAPATALPMANKREFEGRMLAILDPAVKRSTPSRAQTLVLTLGLGALSLTIAAVAPVRRAAPVSVESSIASPSPMPASVSDAPVSPVPQKIAKRDTTKTPLATDTRTATATQTQTQTQSQTQTQTATTSTTVSVAASQFVTSTVNSVMRALQGQNSQQASLDTALLGRILRTDKDADVRKAAAWALQGRREGVPLLLERLRVDDAEAVREMSAWALAGMGSADVAAALADALKRDKSEEVRTTSAWGLGHMGGRADVAALEGSLGDASPDVRERALWALGQQELRAAPARVVALLKDDKEQVRLMAAWVLGQILDKATIPALREAFIAERDTETMEAEFRALAFMGDRSIIEPALKSEKSEIRARAVQMLGGRGPGVWPWPWPWPDPRPSP